MSQHTISLARAADLPQLFDVWHSAVVATHDFLSPADIDFLSPFVRIELERVVRERSLHILRDANGETYAFLCVEAHKIEMLFVHPGQRGNGAGRHLLTFAIDSLGAKAVDVNEHNGLGHGFYLHLGFILENRSELDPFGKPFPHFSLETGQKRLKNHQKPPKRLKTTIVATQLVGTQSGVFGAIFSFFI